jgi:hypothetical protein
MHLYGERIKAARLYIKYESVPTPSENWDIQAAIC